MGIGRNDRAGVPPNSVPVAVLLPEEALRRSSSTTSEGPLPWPVMGAVNCVGYAQNDDHDYDNNDDDEEGEKDARGDSEDERPSVVSSRGGLRRFLSAAKATIGGGGGSGSAVAVVVDLGSMPSLLAPAAEHSKTSSSSSSARDDDNEYYGSLLASFFDALAASLRRCCGAASRSVVAVFVSHGFNPALTLAVNAAVSHLNQPLLPHAPSSSSSSVLMAVHVRNVTVPHVWLLRRLQQATTTTATATATTATKCGGSEEKDDENIGPVVLFVSHGGAGSVGKMFVSRDFGV